MRPIAYAERPSMRRRLISAILCVATTAPDVFAAPPLSIAASPANTVSQAEEPRRADVGFAVGMSAIFAGMLVGGSLATARATTTPGWLVMSGAFALAPLGAHIATGEVVRGVMFSLPPTVGLGAIVTELAARPGTVTEGGIAAQRILWAGFGTGLAGAIVGTIDAANATRRRRIRVLPSLSENSCTLHMFGEL